MSASFPLSPQLSFARPPARPQQPVTSRRVSSRPERRSIVVRVSECEKVPPAAAKKALHRTCCLYLRSQISSSLLSATFSHTRAHNAYPSLLMSASSLRPLCGRCGEGSGAHGGVAFRSAPFPSPLPERLLPIAVHTAHTIHNCS